MTTLQLQGLFSGFSKRSDVLLALFVVGIIFMMTIPLPTQIVDTLIAFSLSIAVILLMVAIYIDSPLDFSAFPAVLLLTTLFRLALSITTTRLILINGDAGHIVYAFGNFVVAGNLVVGIVIFLIITLVQFIVITKGSERVAEVSARFSLDGMPGKQMSIDGDLRAGVINAAEAKKRRQLLEKEIQLYGAMDGAMKFVKGDAIAGLFIILVNILGGISIGMFQKDLSLNEAMHVYSILTVGDGLVAQIPALLIAITAGIIVTRVTTDNAAHLGFDITHQILAQPKALLIGSFFLWGFAFVPGFPTAILLALGLIIGSTGLALLTTENREKRKNHWDFPSPNKGSSQSNHHPLSSMEEDGPGITTPLMVELCDKLAEAFDPRKLDSELGKLRQALTLDVGIPFPGVHLRFSPQLPDRAYLILLDEIPVVRGEIFPLHVLVKSTETELEKHAIAYRKGLSFFQNGSNLWVSKTQIPVLQKISMPYLEITQVLVYHLSLVLRRHGENFIGIQETRCLLDKLETSHPELVKEALAVVNLQKITEILKLLVAEDISIRNLRAILEAIVQYAQKEKQTEPLVDLIRGKLKRQITFRYTNEDNVLPAYLIDPETEKTLREAIRQTPTGRYLMLDPAQIQGFTGQLKKALGDTQDKPRLPVLLVPADIRYYVRKLIEPELFELPVLAYQEISREVVIQPLAQIKIHNEPV